MRELIFSLGDEFCFFQSWEWANNPYNTGGRSTCSMFTGRGKGGISFSAMNFDVLKNFPMWWDFIPWCCIKTVYITSLSLGRYCIISLRSASLTGIHSVRVPWGLINRPARCMSCFRIVPICLKTQSAGRWLVVLRTLTWWRMCSSALRLCAMVLHKRNNLLAFQLLQGT